MPKTAGGESVEAYIHHYWEHIERIWADMAAQWQQKEGFWLLGPANYVFHTDCLWAVDPLLRQRDAEEKLLMRVRNDFKRMRFILISHLHSDHYSLRFLQQACTPGMSIAVPAWIKAEDLSALKKTGAEVITINAHDRLQFDDVQVDVLPGWHYDYNCPEQGVPSLAFLVKSQGKTLLFPGDVRDFEHCDVPVGCDVLVGHVWLGRNCANLPKEQTALMQYAAYARRLQPKHLLLTHLYDLHRQVTDRWTQEHALWIGDELGDTGIKITVPLPGECVELGAGAFRQT